MSKVDFNEVSIFLLAGGILINTSLVQQKFTALLVSCFPLLSGIPYEVLSTYGAVILVVFAFMYAVKNPTGKLVVK
ncbi:hypothetical protein HNP92_000285 [Methanococcus maripaludis]|uniref:Uncharacterized protein n=1 Tax=Methanococcus maripaludis TaxID=39152 RepID=A0A7J9S410_METMI|nr:hypothetical protein [Methanococcus maripaludis]MBB6401000.1 hypothetical protein [Methanococcus maripaludis]